MWTVKLDRAGAGADRSDVDVEVVGFEKKQKVGKRFDPRPNPG